MNTTDVVTGQIISIESIDIPESMTIAVAASAGIKGFTVEYTTITRNTKIRGGSEPLAGIQNIIASKITGTITKMNTDKAI